MTCVAGGWGMAKFGMAVEHQPEQVLPERADPTISLLDSILDITVRGS